MLSQKLNIVNGKDRWKKFEKKNKIFLGKIGHFKNAKYRVCMRHVK